MESFTTPPTTPTPTASLGIHRAFYRQAHSRTVYQYIADCTVIENRKLSALIVRVSDEAMTYVDAASFAQFIVVPKEIALQQFNPNSRMVRR